MTTFFGENLADERLCAEPGKARLRGDLSLTLSRLQCRESLLLAPVAVLKPQ
jgi:hypothetical protein